MSRKIVTGLVFLLVISAAVAMPMAAQAEGTPHWYVSWVFVKKPVSVRMRDNAALTFDLTALGATVTCHVAYTDVVVNPSMSEAGTDEMTAFGLSKCKPAKKLCPTSALEVLPRALPWSSHLIVGPPIRDVIEGVELAFVCSGGSQIGTFAGTLSPIVNDRQGERGCKATNPKPCASLEYQGEQSLSGESGFVDVTGVDHIKTTIEVKVS